ncbi:LuxR C-terminal-related transcriptional regulator [Chryseobacterium sp. 7]|uniref:LuxR C-terminal-related transcriptional regulator n=1 Tax=Chryseobacterium sp. 7 TaxID=2035214 RepID=UPI000EAD769F|nr:LuxR C-terminal-related transcriptional regulator [Chryseobacterium sp. 7]
MKKNIDPINIEQLFDFFSKKGDLDNNYYDFFEDTINSAENFAIGPFFWFITNNIKMRTEVVSPNIKQFTPFTKNDWINSDTNFFMSLFHPDDRPQIMGAFVFSATMRLNLLRSGKKGIRFNYYGRMLDSNGAYRWILLQSPLQRINDNFEIQSSLVLVYDLSHFVIQSLPLLSVIDMSNKEVHYFRHVNQDVHKEIDVDIPAITAREKEILKLMALGLNTPQIAEKLFISYHTVENHKSNLRKKTNTKTSAELIAFTMKYSLLMV